MAEPYYAGESAIRARIVADINGERARRAAEACCAGAGSCGDRDCQIASTVDDVLADIADMIASGGAKGHR